jgi:hypothetical protein
MGVVYSSLFRVICPCEGTLKPNRAVWSEAETKLLIQVEEELQGTKNINIAIDEILKSKTAKQITFFLPFTAWVLWRTSGHILC